MIFYALGLAGHATVEIVDRVFYARHDTRTPVLAAVLAVGVNLLASLLLSGSFARLRDIKWLFSHAGGTIPMMAGRIDSFYGARPNLKEFAPDGIEGELKRLHYDTANATHPAQMAALMKLVAVSQITYGTDYPYFPTTQIENLRKLGLSADQLQAIGSHNAERLVPRVKV